MDLSPRFAVRRFREGYDPAEVDAFIDRVQAAIAQSPPALTTDDLLDVRFTVRRQEASYDMGQVDDWIASMLHYLRSRQRTRPTSPGQDASLPVELRGADLPTTHLSPSGPPAWARLTALILVFSLVAFVVATAFV